MLKSLLTFIVLGAVAGFAYSWRSTAASTAQAIAAMRKIPVDPANPKFTVSYVKGYRRGTSYFMAMLGVVAGIVAWAIWRGIVWIFG
jgi:hypothetical protein